MKFVLVALSLAATTFAEPLNQAPFPDDFLFGVATAAYQVEGAWNLYGKGESIWDNFCHTRPEMIKDGSNGDIACDSYHKYAEDVQMIKSLGVNFYRFSISWPRILPYGTSTYKNQEGIDYYNNLINELLANGIQPMVTLYHWDLPQKLQELGGWTNPMIEYWFEDYARVAFENFGDRVKTWITMNEASVVCGLGYSNIFAPGLNQTGVGDYMCSHYLLKAHARAWHLYDEEFRATQGGKIGITINAGWHEPWTQTPDDIAAAERKHQWDIGWFANPVIHGDYPEVMKQRVAERSALEGFPRSRLVEFTPEESAYLKGTTDFFGLNHYTSSMVVESGQYPIGWPSMAADSQTAEFADGSWPPSAVDWLKVVPWGFRKLLVYIKDNYLDPEIYVTENGFADVGEKCDLGRTVYYQLYLSAMLDAMVQDGVKVKAYTAWSLMDNFEWADGYTARFGINHVDFNRPDRPRTPKLSSEMFRQIVANRQLPAESSTADTVDCSPFP